VPEIANAPAPTCNRTVPDGLGMGMRNAQWLCQRTNRQRKGRRHRTFLGRLTCPFAFTVAHLANPSLSVNRHSPPLSNCLGRTAVRPYTIRYSPFATRCRFPRPADLPTADLPAVSVVADSHSNNQLSFAQSSVAIRHSLPFSSWLIATPTICQSLIASRHSLIAAVSVVAV
jgi:hypothetical protein